MTCEPADLRGPETALRLARDACAMTHNEDPSFLNTLALAQHLTGDTPAAIETEKKALSLLAPDARRAPRRQLALVGGNAISIFPLKTNFRPSRIINQNSPPPW